MQIPLKSRRHRHRSVDLPSRSFGWTSALLLIVVLFLASSSGAVAGAAFEKKLSVIDKALQEAYPGAKIDRVTCVLTPEQRKKVGKVSAQDDYPRKTTFAYVARKDGRIIGTAFFDSHVVRTKRETLMVKVSPEGRLQGTVTVAFQEPPEYIAQDSFYGSLEGRAQGRALQLGRGLDGTTGATLTCAAVAKAARRVLGVHEVLGEKVGRKVPKKGQQPAARRGAKTPAPQSP